MNPDDWLTVHEIAERLKVNQQTVRNWLDAEKLPHYRIGRRIRISREDFEAFTQGRTSGLPTAQDSIWDGLPVLAHPSAEDRTSP